MSNTVEPILRVARQALGKTEQGEANWTETDVEYVFSLHLPRGSITIEEREEGRIRLAIVDSRGLEVDEYITSYRLGQSDDELSLNDVLRDLYALAKRRALDTDKVIENILEDL